MLRLSSLLLLIVFANQSLAEEVQLTSDKLKDLVATRNERVLAKDYEKQSAELREGSYGRSFLPKVHIYGSQESFKKGTQPSKTQPAYGAEVAVNIFNGGIDRLSESRHEVTTKRKSAEKFLTIAEQVSEAHTLYWDILYSRDYLKLISDAQLMNQNNLKSANRRIQSRAQARRRKHQAKIQFSSRAT